MKEADDLADTVYDTLKTLTEQFPDVELEPKVKEIMDFYESSNMLQKHLTGIIKNRTFTITGDEGHASVQFILNGAKKIDEPRKYDFQDEDVNERDFLRSVLRIAPERFGFVMDSKKLAACIAGDETITFEGNYNSDCYDCAKRLRMTLNGNNIHIDCESACENNGEFSVEIDFPTGEVVYGDWPDRFSEVKDAGYLDDGDECGSINYLKGQRQRSEVFARQGIFHQSVGNTCPSWWYNEATNQIQIGNGYNEEEDEEIVPEGFESKGSFCTDLWWVTMLDKSLYDELVSKLDAKRSKKYYTKNLDIAKIKPGRYRFTTVPRTPDDDDYRTVFTKAEYIGPCTGTLKATYITDGKKLLTPKQMAISKAMKYPTLYHGQAEHIRFRVMDHIFNSIGNGIRSKGEFLAHISVPAATVIPDEMPVSTTEPDKWTKNYVQTPYPNFDKQYSTFWQIPRDVLTLDWLEELQWYYNECKAFFASDNVGHYSGAFPGKGGNSYTVKSQTEAFNGRRKEGMTDEEWKAAITKDWGCEFDGDVEAFCLRSWAKNKAKIDAFIEETLKEIDKQIKKRKNA